MEYIIDEQVCEILDFWKSELFVVTDFFKERDPSLDLLTDRILNKKRLIVNLWQEDYSKTASFDIFCFYIFLFLISSPVSTNVLCVVNMSLQTFTMRNL